MAGLVASGAAGLLLVGVTGPFAAAKTQVPASGFSASETIRRTFVENGVTKVVDKRHFSLTVSETKNLRNRQGITVSWRGAHPTGGAVADQTSQLASEEEYPVVLMMCRGVASSKAPAKDRLSPDTCWTATPLERSQSNINTQFPPYRVDQYASTHDRGPDVGLPSPIPANCAPYNLKQGVVHWVPFVGADGTVYSYGPNGCAGLPPEATISDGSQPSNTTYGVTAPSGRGATNFIVTTDESNASLGCSNTVACSLVAVPIMGISCDPEAFGQPTENQPATPKSEQQAATNCEAKGNYAPGQNSAGLPDTEALTVSGQLWWSESNWRNRIVVPLSFSPSDDVCSLVNSEAPVDVYGSPLLTQATAQWAPYFCTNKSLFNFQHVITSEPEAKNLLQQGSIGAAFQGVPPETAFTTPTVQAPVALSGFAVVYKIDTSAGTQYFHLKLDARLLAKLLTESYPANTAFKGADKQLKNNPIDLALDPEFQALNPGIPQLVESTDPASTILTLSSDSDVTLALTSYINDDPEARAWLNGKPDPWGMKVNPAYKGIKLPVNSFPLLDTSIPEGYYAGNQCMAGAPVPYLPLVAAPVESQAQITLNMQFDISNSQINCVTSPAPALKPFGREAPGQRFLLGITSLADARRYDLPAAALQTSGGSTSSTKFTDVKGRTFAAPTNSGLQAGAKALTWSKAVHTWVLPYASLGKTTSGRIAYPGTMLLSTDVATSGLDKKTAQDFSDFLQFAAGRGQQPGFGNGDLPPGYLPLTAANGLGDEVAYTHSAVQAVKDQKGQIPSSKGTLPGGSPTPTKSSTASSSASPSPSASSSSSSGANPSDTTTPGSSATPTPTPSSSSSPSAHPTTTASATSLGNTAVLAADGLPAKAFPIALIVVIASVLGLGGFGLRRRFTK